MTAHADMSDKVRRPMTEHTFASFDGAALYYRAWLPAEPATRAVLLFHRGHEHSGRWREVVMQMGLRDTAVFAWDQRGHGRSPGERGSAEHLCRVVKDMDCFARHLVLTHGMRLEETAVVASSVGAVIAAAWVHDFAPPIRGMVLAAPAFRVKLYVPLAVPALRLKERFLPGGYVKSYVKPAMLTHDKEQAAAYAEDPLIFRQISIQMLLNLHDAGNRLVADAGAIQVPTLILAAGRDWVVDLGMQRQFFERLGSVVKRMEVYPEAYHSLFHDSVRADVIEKTGVFLRECLERPGDSEALLEADKGGMTRTEYDLLRMPGSARWGVMRAGMKTFGRLSRGVRLGLRAGFDSGVTLDYVYRNKAGGITPLGWLIDKFYLRAIGWRGIRQRRENLQRLLLVAIEHHLRAGEPVHILDIAAGPGRYVLETLAKLKDETISATLRDYQEVNVKAAAALATELHVHNVDCEIGDAFDWDAVAACTPQPTIAIASGLYELFPDNAPVRRSLDALAAAMDPGGLLIYTAQIWHPELEMIARTLTNREGKPWIMRRRTQAEMDALVRAAGFEKVDQDVDQWGIFTVALARRVA